jgi:glycine cleavage system protein P-like pyridoxal-binding family
MAKAKTKAPRSSKKAQQKLVQLMSDLEKKTAKVEAASKALGSCSRFIYCV